MTTEGTSHTSEEHQGRLPSVALRAPAEGPKALTDRQRKQDVSIVTVGNVDILAWRRWKLVAKGARGAISGACRQDAEKWLNRGGAGRSRGVFAEPVALQPPEVAQRRRSQRQGGQKAPSTTRCIKVGFARRDGALVEGSESTQHHKVH